MNSSRGKQDVLRCDLCETSMPLLHCDICHVNLCKPCVGEHVLDETKEHKIVPFKKRGSTPKCLKHSSKMCELHCEQCDCPICALCVSSFDHEQHIKVDIFKKFEEKKATLRRELQKLEDHLYPKYQDILSEIPIQRKDLNRNSQNLKAAINKQGRDMQREIESVITKMKADVDDMNSQHLADLKKREDEIGSSISELKQNMSDIKKLLDSYDICQVCAYKSKKTAFRKMPPKITVCLPKFIPHQLDETEISKQFGSLLELRVITEEYYFTSVSGVPSLPNKSLMNTPIIISNVNTESDSKNTLFYISCISDKEFWTSSADGIMRLYNLRGEIVKSTQTRSGALPYTITIIRFGDLIYADSHDKSLNIVTKAGVHTMIRLRGWRPRGLCSTSSDELLVVIVNDNNNQTKIVRYSGSTETQSIQFDDKGKPLFSATGNSDFPQCICENTNLDICVADIYNNAVVVVNQNGEFRFRYTPSELFYPVGIATDSQSRILISGRDSDIIHIVDQD